MFEIGILFKIKCTHHHKSSLLQNPSSTKVCLCWLWLKSALELRLKPDTLLSTHYYVSAGLLSTLLMNQEPCRGLKLPTAVPVSRDCLLGFTHKGSINFSSPTRCSIQLPVSSPNSESLRQKVKGQKAETTHRKMETQNMDRTCKWKAE